MIEWIDVCILEGRVMWLEGDMKLYSSSAIPLYDRFYDECEDWMVLE